MFKNFFITAWRSLVRHKTTATFNIVGLAIGITVCLLIGVWLRQELTFDRFHSQQIYRIYNTFKSESESFTQAPSCIALGAHLPGELAAVNDACRVFNWSYRIRYGEKQYFEDRARIVDANFLQMFGFPLIHGDAATALSAPGNIVFSAVTAEKYFGSAEDALGKQVLLDGEPMVVTGVVDNSR